MYALEVIPKVRYHTKYSYLKMNIWMKDFCQEPHLRRLQRILLRNSESKLEDATLIRSL
jgi:hypothetical protein